MMKNNKKVKYIIPIYIYRILVEELSNNKRISRKNEN